MNHIAEPAHKEAAARLRELYYLYAKSEDLINIGAYKKGTSAEIDEAIHYEPIITNFLKQGFKDHISLEETMAEIVNISTNGGMR